MPLVCSIVKCTYEPIALAEIGYRGITASVEECLKDTFDSGLCIAARGKVDSDEYVYYVKGVAAGNIEYEDLLQWVLDHQN